jgi:hypothetical protein
VVGKWAQLYTGAGVGEPVGNLPYTDAAVSAATTAAAGTGTGPGTGWNVATNGYINNTKVGSPVTSPLTLKLGSLNDFWLVLNGRDYAENGGTSFSMLPGGIGATFCNSDPTQDLSDPDRATAGPAGPMLDVKVSQRHLPLFFPLVSGRPTLHAHARVQLQGEASTPSEPIAVSDNGFTPCVSVNLVNASTDAVIQTVTLTKVPPVNPADPVQWDNSGSPLPFTMPASANVYLQPFLNNCNGSGNLYDGDTNTGLLYVNNHPANDPTVGAGDPPELTPGGVFVTGGPCPGASTQYFSSGACTVVINAFVKFDPALTANKTVVLAYDRAWDNVNNVYTTTLIGNAQGMNQDNADHTKWTEGFTIPDTSGMHQIELRWRQETGNVNGTACTSASPCTGSFGVQQQVFGACNGCDQPDDSGPVIFARLSDNGANDSNSLAGASGGHNLVITLKLAGLSAAQYPDPPTVLRFPTSGNHQTGLVDCGQGNSASADAAVVYYGCGPQNPQFNPPLNPIFINTRNTCGTPPGPPWPGGNQQDCVQTTPGTRRTGIICPLVLRIVKVPFTNPVNCNSNGVGTCPENFWTKNLGNVNAAGDPRALTMIVTSAADFGSVAGSPQGWVPVRRFATFYITGWDSGIKPQCPSQGQFVGNEAFPGTGKKNSQNAAVWGHWINYVDSAGTGNNQPCQLNSVQPINCVPVLTR